MSNETMRALRERKSVRVFEERPVGTEIRRALLEAALQAPTAGNQMLYTIIDITEQERKRVLADLCDHQSFIATAPVVYVFVADCRRWLDLYRTAGMQPHRPGQGDILLAMADAVIAAQNMVVAAESLGLGSCYIGDILEHCEAVRALLSLPAEVMPAAMLVIGHPTAQQRARPKPPRFDAQYVVHENAYRLLAADEQRTMYLQREALDGKDMSDIDFDQRIGAFCKRKYESEFSKEMNRSAAEYLSAFASADSSQT